MAEQSKKRGIPDVQQEYQASCTQAGHLQYQLFTIQQDLDMVNQKLRELNIEAASIKEAEAKAAAEQNVASVTSISEAVR